MDAAATARPASLSGPARWAATGAWLAIVVGVVGSALVWIVRGSPPLPLRFGQGGLVVAAVGLNALAYGTVGALLAIRLPRNPIGWLLLAGAFPMGMLTPVNLAVEQSFGVARLVPPLTVLTAWLMSSTLAPFESALFIMVCLLFPDGRFAQVGGRAAAAGALAGAIMLSVASAVDPTGLVWYPALPNPAAVPGSADVVAVLRVAGAALLALALPLAIASMVARYRHSDRRVRLQLRWIVAAMVFMTAGLVPFLAMRYVVATGDAAGEMVVGLGGLAVCFFPLAIAIAIVREHLFDVDRIITRTLVYVPLMGLLAGLYAASVAFFQRLFLSVTGSTSDTAVVLSALTLAAVFGPTRSALEGRVGRHFKPSPAAPGSEGRPAEGTDARAGSGEAGDPQAGALEGRLGAIESRLLELEARTVGRRGHGRSAGPPGTTAVHGRRRRAARRAGPVVRGPAVRRVRGLGETD